MTSSEHVWQALRRSRRLVIICAVVGVVAMLALGELLGDEYQASSSVVVQDGVQAAASVGASPSSTDASTDALNAATLAGTPAFAQYLAGVLHEHDVTTIEHAISAQQSGTSNIVQFTASASTANRALSLANTARTAFPAFSATISTAPITAAERALAVSGNNPQIQASIQRLRVLAGISGTVTALSSAASATRTRPLPSREVLEGLLAGLIVGLLIMALREGLDKQARVSREIELALDLSVWGLLPRPRGGPSPAAPHSSGAEALKIASLIEARPGGGGTVVAIAGGMSASGRTWVAATMAAALNARGGTVCAIDDGGGVLIDLLRDGSSPAGDDNANANGNGNGATPDTAPAALASDRGPDLTAAVASAPPPTTDPTTDPAPPTPTTSRPTPASTAELPRTRQGRLVVLPAWSAARGLEQLRSQFDWIVVDVPWPSDAAHAVQSFAGADTVLLVVALGSVSREQLVAYGRELDAWPRRADAVILTTAG